MWLPTPLYERVPQFWLLLGMLFMVCGAYVGFGFRMAFVYFAIGFACVLCSATILLKRLRFRMNPLHRPIRARHD